YSRSSSSCLVSLQRGNRLKEYLPVKWALLLSALAFGIGHGNLVQGVYGFALGYMMAYLYERTGKLWVPVLFHIVANSISVLITESGIFDVLYLNEITVLLSGAVGVLIALGGMMAIQRVLPETQPQETFDDYMQL
ncbi:MAG: CPBP family intramembrane metalloprotease, partial [Lachnospiraceae bacterium]|nr:CPBP family intramembrane metalloprotease [Lachnospiraceae bacterium]